MLPRTSAASKVARRYRYARTQASVRVCTFVGACRMQFCGILADARVHLGVCIDPLVDRARAGEVTGVQES